MLNPSRQPTRCLAVLLALAMTANANALTVVSYPDPAKPVFTRLNAPLCPTYAALENFMQRAYAHDVNATLFDFGCFPAAAGWRGEILVERQEIDLWAKTRVTLPGGIRRIYWTIAWEMQNGPAPPLSKNVTGAIRRPAKTTKDKRKHK
jgi:hypothetical protein